MTQPKTPIDIMLFHVKKDYFVIIVCCLALLACLYTINSVGEYQQQINEHWMNEAYKSKCWQRSGVIPVPANVTFNLWGNYNDTDQDID